MEIHQSDEISLKELIFKLIKLHAYLMSKWRLVLFCIVIGMLVGFAYAYYKSPIYTAECTFVLEEEGKSGLGQYAGLAAMIGIDIGGSGGGGIFQGDNIIELYKSHRMIKKTLLSTFYVDNKNPELIITRFIKANKLYKKRDNLAPSDLDFSKYSGSVKQDSIIGEIVEEINKSHLKISKPDKKLSIISVEFTSKDQLLAKAFTEKIVANVNEFYVQTRTKKSVQNLAILQRQADSVKNVLDISIGGAAYAIDKNPNANSALQVLRVPSQKKQIDVQANSAIYGEIVKNLEIAKISLRKETPLIQIIDNPTLPLRSEKIGKVRSTLFGGLLLGLAAVVALIFRLLFKNIMLNE